MQGPVSRGLVLSGLSKNTETMFHLIIKRKSECIEALAFHY